MTVKQVQTVYTVCRRTVYVWIDKGFVRVARTPGGTRQRIVKASLR